jgi:fermentation-respiration switch protein FrsA (DUF1100 family)
VLADLRRLAIFPGRALLRGSRDAGAGINDLERLSLDTEEGRVEGWLLRAPGATSASPAPLVLFAHGNGELIEHWPEALAPYRALGLHVLLPEYRGYGRSAGRPSEAKTVADLTRFHDLVAARPDVDASRIVLHGRSLGGGAVCGLARARKPRAMILWSTFTSIPDIARRFYVPRALVPDVFDNLEVVRTLDAPLLVVHGTRDRLIPFAHAETLARAHHDAVLRPDEGAEHNDCPRSMPWYFAEAERFLRDAGVL